MERIGRLWPSAALVLLASCSGDDTHVGSDADAPLDSAVATDAGAPLDANVLDAAAAGTDAGPPDAPDASVGDAGPPGGIATCAKAFGAEVCSATLDPAITDSAIEPVGTPAGMHWFCYPGPSVTWNGRVVVHLVGTGSDPATDHRFPERACSLGFAAVAPMYENAIAGRTACADDGPCFEAFHTEVAYGIADAPMVTVDAANSITSRLDALLAWLAREETRFAPWAAISDTITRRDMSAVTISGHSQGSGHALFLARDLAADRLVMLSGVTDRIASGTSAQAVVPWIAALATTPTLTPPARAYGYLHDDDTLAVLPEVDDNWSRIGLGSTCVYASAGGYATGCRRIRIPTAGCGGIAAHTVPVVVRFTDRCVPGLGTNLNEATWAFLLEGG